MIKRWEECEIKRARRRFSLSLKPNEWIRHPSTTIVATSLLTKRRHVIRIIRGGSLRMNLSKQKGNTHHQSNQSQSISHHDAGVFLLMKDILYSVVVCPCWSYQVQSTAIYFAIARFAMYVRTYVYLTSHIAGYCSAVLRMPTKRVRILSKVTYYVAGLLGQQDLCQIREDWRGN